MKANQLLVISTHSFVDLITNSSTELFVCDTDKTLSAIKELLATLLKNHNDIEGECGEFDTVFGTIEPAMYNFSWWDVSDAVRDQYEKYHDYCPFGKSQLDMFYGSTENSEQQLLEEEERKLNLKHNVYEKGLYERNKEEYDRRWKACRIDVDALWTNYGGNVLQSERDLFIEFLKQNNFSNKLQNSARKIYDAEINKHIANKKGKHPFIWWKFPKKLAIAHKTFNVWESWGITAKKGNILVYSASDNSIPFKMMDTISSYLNADRYHLG